MPYEQGLVSVIAENVADVRKERRWLQSDLAGRLGDVGGPEQQSWISRLESGQRGISVEELLQLAAALDVSPTRLMLRLDGGPLEVSGRLAVDQGVAEEWIAGLRELPYVITLHSDGSEVYERLEGVPITPEEVDERSSWFERMGTLRMNRIRRVRGLWLILVQAHRLADAVALAGVAHGDREDWQQEARQAIASIRRNLDRIEEDFEAGEL